MTQISYIRGLAKQVGANELPDRGREVPKAAPYIPYLGLSNGELELVLLQEQLKVLAAAYPDFPDLRRGLTMVENALYKGVHNGVSFIGAVPDNLQEIAWRIRQAEGETGTAGGELFNVRDLKNGVHIGADPIVPITTQDCKWLATVATNRKFHGRPDALLIKNYEEMNATGDTKGAQSKRYWLQAVADCEFKKFMENLLNEKLETCSHHLLYKSVQNTYPRIAGTALSTKRILHNGGIQTLGNVATVLPPTMSSWVELGVLRRNSGSNVGPMGSIQSGFSVAADGKDEEYQKYMDWAKGQIRVRGNSDHIQVAPAVVIAIIGLIGTAIGAAVTIIESINKQKTAAMAAAYGFGTTAYSAEKGDINTASTAVDNELAGNNLIVPALLFGGLWLASKN